MSDAIWGIDLGGTKIEGVILPSLNNSQPLLRMRVPTEGHKGYDHIIGQLKTLVENMKAESGITPNAIGIGTPGVLDPILKTMKNCNSTSLNGKPLLDDAQQALSCEVKLANDANCFALAETHWGAVKEKAPFASVVFGIILGTGVGGGIVINGKIWNGLHGIAGEWGHNFLDESGGQCYCGKTGCVETILAGPSLERFYFQQTGNKLKLKEIMERYQTGNDFDANVMMERLLNYFGKAISVVINILDPDVIVIGGGVGNIDELYAKGQSYINKYIFNNRTDIQVLKPMLGDSAGVFGAAALVAV